MAVKYKGNLNKSDLCKVVTSLSMTQTKQPLEKTTTLFTIIAI